MTGELKTNEHTGVFFLFVHVTFESHSWVVSTHSCLVNFILLFHVNRTVCLRNLSYLSLEARKMKSSASRQAGRQSECVCTLVIDIYKTLIQSVDNEILLLIKILKNFFVVTIFLSEPLTLALFERNRID